MVKILREHTEEELKIVGDVDKMMDEGRAFRRTAMALHRDYDDLLERYPDKCVAYHDARLVAVADSLQALLRKVEECGIPRKGLYARFLQTDPPDLIV